MNVEIGTEAAQFPKKEDINRIFVAVLHTSEGTPALAVFRPNNLSIVFS